MMRAKSPSVGGRKNAHAREQHVVVAGIGERVDLPESEVEAGREMGATSTSARAISGWSRASRNKVPPPRLWPTSTGRSSRKARSRWRGRARSGRSCSAPTHRAARRGWLPVAETAGDRQGTHARPRGAVVLEAMYEHNRNRAVPALVHLDIDTLRMNDGSNDRHVRSRDPAADNGLSGFLPSHADGRHRRFQDRQVSRQRGEKRHVGTVTSVGDANGVGRVGQSGGVDEAPTLAVVGLDEAWKSGARHRERRQPRTAPAPTGHVKGRW